MKESVFVASTELEPDSESVQKITLRHMYWIILYTYIYIQSHYTSILKMAKTC